MLNYVIIGTQWGNYPYFGNTGKNNGNTLFWDEQCWIVMNAALTSLFCNTGGSWWAIHLLIQAPTSKWTSLSQASDILLVWASPEENDLERVYDNISVRILGLNKSGISNTNSLLLNAANSPYFVCCNMFMGVSYWKLKCIIKNSRILWIILP